MPLTLLAFVKLFSVSVLLRMTHIGKTVDFFYVWKHKKNHETFLFIAIYFNDYEISSETNEVR